MMQSLLSFFEKLNENKEKVFKNYKVKLVDIRIVRRV